MTSLTCLATTVACGSGAPPELSGLKDEVAQVGTVKEIMLNGTDPDGDQLSYRFKAPGLMDINSHAGITVSPAGAGVFRWTPLANDVGEHAFDFTVSDGDHDTTVTINIDVRSAVGSATAPIFRSPLGTGTTIDLTKKKCVDLDIDIEDQDTAEVTIAMEEPKIAGATLDQIDGSHAKFSWCPSREQEAEQRYTLSLSADDGDNPKSTKNYLIVLRGNGAGTSCPGTAPVISHTPANESTIVNLTVPVTVTDDQGLKESPLFYYSLTNPGTMPNLGPGGMTQLSTIKITGTATNGQYAADVPNPVAGMPSGTSRTIYYVFVADDDDDETGNCDHSTQSQVYSMTVTSTGSANLGICATCTTDSQCGAGDLCVRVGNMGASYCLQACGTGCPTNYACSAGDVFSVDGARARQCVPNNGSCTMPTAACVDDSNEDDDTQSQASANATADGPMSLNATVDGVSCPKPVQPASGSKADDDWRQLKIEADSRVDMWLYGNGESDLDLQIYTSSGALVSKSTTLTADENIVKCLTPATYYVKVNGFTNARSEYLLDTVTTAQTCNTTCTDDAREDDDTYSQARTVTGTMYTSTSNVTCPNDDDWYKVTLAAGKKLTMDLTFTQSNSTQDLDIHLYRGFTNLWPCSFEDPSMCSTARGQGAVSNEHAEYTATTAGDYYVVIRGYNGSTNSYGLTLKVQ
ncbi:MAG: pre-peptidase C-terminal domain-containing protein [Deltaproteobacteria bacterium]|nr:pre-peptidase C-terminal domain-containing protein [Deltaproteobacteria bacterium]